MNTKLSLFSIGILCVSACVSNSSSKLPVIDNKFTRTTAEDSLPNSTPAVATPLDLKLCSSNVSNPPPVSGLIVNRVSALACTNGVKFKVAPATGACMTSGFGRRGSRNKLHKGIDYQGPGKTAVEVIAAASGEVVINKWRSDLGNWIVLDHGNDVYTGYGHLASASNLQPGQKIKQGEILGMMGATGSATTKIHLHVEFRKGKLVQAQHGGFFNLKPFNPFAQPAEC